jgi:hypothetical protein
MKERKINIFKNTLASVTMDTTMAKDDTNLHVEAFVFFELYLSLLALPLSQ